MELFSIESVHGLEAIAKVLSPEQTDSVETIHRELAERNPIGFSQKEGDARLMERIHAMILKSSSGRAADVEVIKHALIGKLALDLPNRIRELALPGLHTSSLSERSQ